MDSTKNMSFSIFLLLRNSMYSAIALLNRFSPNDAPRIVVYCYHSISNDGWRFSVTENDFKKQIEILLKDQMPLAVRDLPSYLSGKKKLTKNAFVITFDDGYEDVLAVKDFLKDKNIYPTIFVLSHHKEANYKELETIRPFLSSKQLVDLQASEWEIGSHGATHANFAHLSPDQKDKEIAKSKIELEKITGKPVSCFAYPKGVYDSEILKTVSTAGYTLGFTVNDGYVDTKTNALLIPRVGVDGTHTLAQFPHLASPLAMAMRKLVKKFL